MSRRSQLVAIFTLAIVCVMAESRPGFGGSGTGSGAGTGSAGPAGLSETRVAGLSTHNVGIKRPNGEVGKPNHAVPVVAEVGFLSPGGGGYGEREEAARVSPFRVAGISSAQSGGVGTGTSSGTGFGSPQLGTGSGAGAGTGNAGPGGVMHQVGISSAQNGGVGTGSGTGAANLNLFPGQAGATGQGSGSSVGK